ncbi:hypothetical protein ACET3Z_025562 [Daucus carota]
MKKRVRFSHMVDIADPDKLNDDQADLYLSRLWSLLAEEKAEQCLYVDSLLIKSYYDNVGREKVFKRLLKDDFFGKKYVFFPICLCIVVEGETLKISENDVHSVLGFSLGPKSIPFVNSEPLPKEWRRQYSGCEDSFRVAVKDVLAAMRNSTISKNELTSDAMDYQSQKVVNKQLGHGVFDTTENVGIDLDWDLIPKFTSKDLEWNFKKEENQIDVTTPSTEIRSASPEQQGYSKKTFEKGTTSKSRRDKTIHENNPVSFDITSASALVSCV